MKTKYIGIILIYESRGELKEQDRFWNYVTPASPTLKGFNIPSFHFSKGFILLNRIFKTVFVLTKLAVIQDFLLSKVLVWI